MRIKSILAVALAALTLASCAKEENNGKVTDGKDFYIKISNGAATRAEGDDMDATSVTFNSGYLIFTTGKSINKVIEIVSTPADGKVAVSQLETGYVIEELEGSTDNCYLLGNLGSSLTGIGAKAVVGGDYADIEALAWTLTNLQNAANTVADVPVYGHGTVAYAAANDRLESAFDVAPVAARIQIGEVTISDAIVDNFKLAGIYINGFYHSMNADFSTTGYLVDYGVDKAKYVPAYSGYTAMRDDFSTTPLTKGSASPSAKAYWAYNVFPGKMPHIVLHFSEITFVGGNTPAATNKFATVSKYNTAANGAAVGTAEVGKAYTISSIDITDYATQIDDVPEANSKLQGYVKIGVITWEKQVVYPEW